MYSLQHHREQHGVITAEALFTCSTSLSIRPLLIIAIVLSMSVFSGGTARSVLAACPYAGAANDHTVLILGTSVSGGLSSVEAVQATALGYTVEIASAAQWVEKNSGRVCYLSRIDPGG